MVGCGFAVAAGSELSRVGSVERRSPDACADCADSAPGADSGGGSADDSADASAAANSLMMRPRLTPRDGGDGFRAAASGAAEAAHGRHSPPEALPAPPMRAFP